LAERQNGERLGFLSLAYCGFLRFIRAPKQGVKEQILSQFLLLAENKNVNNNPEGVTLL